MEVGSGLLDLAYKVRDKGSAITKLVNTVNGIKYPTDDEIFVADSTIESVKTQLKSAAGSTDSISKKIMTINTGLENAKKVAEGYASELNGVAMDSWTHIDLRQAEMLRGLDEKDIAARGYEGNSLGGLTYVEPRQTIKDYEKFEKDMGNIADDEALNAVLDEYGIELPDDPIPGIKYKYTEGKGDDPSKIQIGDNFTIYSDGTVETRVYSDVDGVRKYRNETVDPAMIKAILNDGVGGSEQLARVTGISETDLYDGVPDSQRGNLSMPIYDIKLENGSQYTYSDKITPYVAGFNNVEGKNIGYLVDEDGEINTGYVADPNSSVSGIQGIYANGHDTFIVFRQGGAGPWSGTPLLEPSRNISGAGCGITSLSTIMHGLGVNVIPEDFRNMRSADDGVELNHMDEYGMQHKVLENFDQVVEELKAGHQVLYHLHGKNMSAGAFYTGHYVSLLGIDENGNIFVGDPAQPGNVGYHSQDEFRGFYSAFSVWNDDGARWIDPDEAKDRYNGVESIKEPESPAKVEYEKWKEEQKDKNTRPQSTQPKDVTKVSGTESSFDDKPSEEYEDGKNHSGKKDVDSNDTIKDVKESDDGKQGPGTDFEWTGKKLTRQAGRIKGKETPSGYDETYYDLDMSNCLRYMGISPDEEVIREDGVKTYNGYVLVASPNLDKYPKGSYVETTLGMGYVVDYCPEGNLDIAVKQSQFK